MTQTGQHFLPPVNVDRCGRAYRLVFAYQEEPWIRWHGWSDGSAIACIVLVSDEHVTIWWNTRHVARHEHALVDLWARWHIEHGSRFVVLWQRDLDALRD